MKILKYAIDIISLPLAASKNKFQERFIVKY